MKILQISNYYYPHVGGIEQVARDISNSVVEDEIKVFCFNHKKENLVDNVDGVEVIKAGSFKKIASQSLSFSYGKLLRKAFADFKPDVVIFHYPNPFGAYHLLRVLKDYPDCKLILYWHLDILKQKFLKKFFNGQNKKLLKRAVKIVATSPNYVTGSKNLSEYSQKCTVIPCCVNKERISADEYSYNRSKVIRESSVGKTICFACGRHVPYKGMEYLIRASKLLPDDFMIYIAGHGPLTEKLKKLAAGDNKIIFVGKISDEELKAYFIASDIFCFPSITKNEAFGIALAEAMSFGKPAVTFTIPQSGVNYVSVGGITGIEAPNRDYVAYAEGIKTLAEDAELRAKYGEAAKQRVEELFTEETFKEHIRELIEGIKND